MSKLATFVSYYGSTAARAFLEGEAWALKETRLVSDEVAAALDAAYNTADETIFRFADPKPTETPAAPAKEK